MNHVTASLTGQIGEFVRPVFPRPFLFRLNFLHQLHIVFEMGESFRGFILAFVFLRVNADKVFELLKEKRFPEIPALPDGILDPLEQFDGGRGRRGSWRGWVDHVVADRRRRGRRQEEEEEERSAEEEGERRARRRERQRPSHDWQFLS